jgi:hypothetical protein
LQKVWPILARYSLSGRNVKLIYVDESGNTGSKRDPNQPIHMNGAVIVDERTFAPPRMRSPRLEISAG